MAYITNLEVRKILEDFMRKIPEWNEKILMEPIKYAISVKVNGRVFMYLCPRRDKFLVETFSREGKWTGYPVNTSDDLESLMNLIKSNMEKKAK